MPSKNKSLGNWPFPSGNSCSAHCELDTEGRGHIWFEWDSPPLLSVKDNKYYQAVVLPGVVRLVESLKRVEVVQ